MERSDANCSLRDEGDMLARWLTHYSGLFGFENLSIMDNGSSDPWTLSLLKDAEARGTHIYWHLNTHHDFLRKGGHIGNIVHHWDAEYNYDFALPVDCDELLGVFTENGLSLDKQKIHTAFEELLGRHSAFRIETSLFNVPERPDWYAPIRHFHKGFLASHSLEICDDGHHEPISRRHAGYQSTRLTYLHNHNRPFENWRARLKNKLSGLVDVDDLDALRAYGNIPRAEGAHLVASLFMSQKDYLHQYDDDVRLSVGPGCTETVVIERPGLAPRIWDNTAYLRKNPDVHGYALGALQHYLRHGFHENRDLGDEG